MEENKPGYAKVGDAARPYLRCSIVQMITAVAVVILLDNMLVPWIVFMRTKLFQYSYVVQGHQICASMFREAWRYVIYKVESIFIAPWTWYIDCIIRYSKDEPKVV